MYLFYIKVFGLAALFGLFGVIIGWNLACVKARKRALNRKFILVKFSDSGPWIPQTSSVDGVYHPPQYPGISLYLTNDGRGKIMNKHVKGYGESLFGFYWKDDTAKIIPPPQVVKQLCSVGYL